MRKLFALVFTLLALAPVGAFAQGTGQNAYTISSLSSALTSTSNTLVVAANTGMTPANNPFQTVGGVSNLVKQLVMVDEELMEVQSVTGSTLASVTRGFGGTLAAPHKSGALTFTGQPAWFVFGDKLGSCTATAEVVLPVFSVNRNSKQVRMYNCLGGQWVLQTVPQVTSGAYKACNYGPGTILTSVGVSSAVAASTTENLAEVFVPQTFYATGASIVSGTTPDSGTTRILTLRGPDGKLIANTATAGTASTGTGSISQTIAFTARLLVTGPAFYLVGYSASGADADGINLFTTAAPAQGVTGQITGLTYGTVPASVTAPTSFNTATGAPSCVY